MSKSLAAVAFNELDHQLTGAPIVAWKTIASKLGEKQSPATSSLFVTWNKSKNHQLRGCIGTFSPQPTEQGVRKYALIAALQDTRFRPIKAEEIPQLEVDVTLLTPLEVIDEPYDWELGKHGIQASWGNHYSATFLPHVPTEQGWDQDDTLEALAQKAGLPPRSNILDGVQLWRYEGIKSGLTYEEYKSLI